MSTYLTKVVETYRADTEAEAKTLIENAKKDSHFVVSKYNNEVKTVKAKGEVIDEYRRVTITKEITSEKEPDVQMNLIYEGEAISFGSAEVDEEAEDEERFDED